MYTSDIGRDFWFDFDNQTLFQRTEEVKAAIKAAYFDQGLNLDTMTDALIASWRTPTHPEPFRERITAGRAGIVALIDIQLRIMRAHLDDDEAMRLAFEDFGQGVLFDDRPPRGVGSSIHMMDGDPTNWVGYRRWLGIVRAAEVLDYPDAAALTHLKRCITLAWAIQTEADPVQGTEANPALPQARLEALRAAWLPLPVAVQDWAIASHRFRAPSLQELQNAGRFKAVQAILEAAAGDGQPFHSNTRRFWNRALPAFMTTVVGGHPVIAAPGPDRGARSAIIKALQGTLPGVPQMPLDRPPLSADQIAFISQWIDAGCPEI
jgi:hypothetical protein